MSSITVPPVRKQGNWYTQPTITGMRRRQMIMGYLFVLPTFLAILLFTAGPVIASFGLSFFEWNVINSPTFVGLDNYERFLNDGVALQSFVRTGIFVIFAVFFQLSIALMLAIGVQGLRNSSARVIFRTAYFVPLLTSAASISIVLAYMFHRNFGVINYYLGKIGIDSINWLGSPTWAMAAIVITYVWQHIGFTFIVFVGGLTGINKEVLEAAELDGASGFRKLFTIIIPMISPTILFALITGVISALQIFDQPYVMTNGGPGDATRTVVMVLYQQAFEFLQYGYGSAIAVALFVLILIITIIQFRLSSRWVFYQ